MNEIFKIGNKVFIKGVLPLELYSLVDYNTKYTIVNINYTLSHPITIVSNNTYLHLTLDSVKLTF